MKREIKFRGKPSKDEPFVYGNLCKGVFGDALIQVTNGNNFIDNVVVLKDTVGQYTGLKDKSGDPIFEGDLISYNTSYENSNDEYEASKEKPEQVKWYEKAASFWPFCLQSRWRCDVEDVEIIGNIYENPEFL